MSHTTVNTIEEVDAFWNENLCGSHFIDEDVVSKEFYDHYTHFRYKKNTSFTRNN